MNLGSELENNFGEYRDILRNQSGHLGKNLVPIFPDIFCRSEALRWSSDHALSLYFLYIRNNIRTGGGCVLEKHTLQFRAMKFSKLSLVLGVWGRPDIIFRGIASTAKL